MGLLSIGKKAVDIIDDLVPDKDLANQLKGEIIKAESSGNWMQRSWRPITALSFVAIIFNYYLIVPYLIALGLDISVPEVPAIVWSGLFGCLGGFIGVRSLFDKRRN